MAYLNDDWLYWPPEELDEFFNSTYESEETVVPKTTNKIESIKEHAHEVTRHAFFS